MRHLLLAGTSLVSAFAVSTLPAYAEATTALDTAATLTAAPAANLPQVTDQGVILYPSAFFDPYRPNTALDMVNQVPGFSVNDGDGARGFEGAVGNVLINGSRPASKSDTGTTVLGRTLAAQVERIELIRGGAPGIEMQGYGVVVNVILKASASSTEHILTHNSMVYDGGRSLFGGSYQLTHRKGENTWGLTLGDTIASSDSIGAGPYSRTAADGTLLRSEDYWTDAYGGGNNIRLTFNGPLLGGSLSATARYGISDWKSVNISTAPDIRRESSSQTDGDFGEVGLTYSRNLSPRLKSETRLIHEFEGYEEIDRSNVKEAGLASPEQLFTNKGESGESILRSLVRYQYSDTLELETGAEIAFNSLKTKQAYSVGGTNVPLPSASVTVEELRGELFGKGTWRINPKWTLEAALRLEHSTISQSGDVDHEDSFFFAKPRLQLSWSPRESTQVRMRFERSVGQLNFGDFAASSEFSSEQVMGGNINLTPEQRWISEITFEQRFMKEGVFSIGYRHDEIRDVIDLIPLEDGLAAVGNIGDGTLDQLKVNLVLPTDRLFIPGGKFSVSNSWNHTEVTDPTSGRTRGVSGLRPSQAEIDFEQNLTALKTTWGITWIPLMSETRYQPDAVSGWEGRNYYTLWADYKPVPSLSIRAQVTVWESFYWQREAYADRNSRPVTYLEVRDITPRPFYQLRLRKTF